MVWLAFDGSLNAEWLSHYARRCARSAARRELKLAFVRDGTLGDSAIEERFARVERHCRSEGLTFDARILPQRADVARTLLDLAAEDPKELLLCGTRVKRRQLGFLGGTVSEVLLRRATCPVLALHVATPGLLGAANRLLLPVMGHPRGSDPALPFLRVLAPGLSEIFILSVHLQGAASALRRSSQFPRLPEESDRWAYVQAIEHQLREALESGKRPKITIDREVVVSDNAAEEIVVAAKQRRAELILLGASQRSAAQRLWGGTPSETILRHAPCDVGIFGGKV
jgi:nucleotide-binding universal stress UspA family protein